MKRFLKTLSAVLKKSKEAKPAACSERPNSTPLLEVRSQVKAGFSITKTTDAASPG
jgi:hypothetical protein